MDDPTVTIFHVRKANLCSRGTRQWFTANKLDYSQFLREGYPASVIEATDALGKRVALIARTEAEKEVTL